MPFPNIDPVIFEIGPFALRWYALAYVAGILIGWRYVVSLVRNPALWPHRGPAASPEQIDDLVLWITIGVIVGGRLGHVLFYTPDWSLYTEDPLEVFKVWKGGMSFHGGALGVLAAVLIFARANGLDTLRIMDVVVAAQPIGQFFGRIANFINGELWGRPTDLPWGMVFPADPYALARHPSQIYEAILEGVVLFLVLRWATHGPKLLDRRGVVAGIFMIGYGVSRFLVEFVREPDVGMDGFPLGLTMGMMLSVPMALLGAYLVWRGMREPVPETIWEPAGEEPVAAKPAAGASNPGADEPA